MAADSTKPPAAANVEAITFSQFLASTPPGKETAVKDLIKANHLRRTGTTITVPTYELNTPPIKIYCANTPCQREQIFRCVSNTHGGTLTSTSPATENFYMTYRCGNCSTTTKQISIRATSSVSDNLAGMVIKFGEIPPFGLPPTPPRLLSMLDEQKNNFFAGRRSESYGLGIGAFAYYRRVVEHQKNNIIEQIIKVAKKLDAPDEMIAQLERAASEDQFSKSVDMVKDAIPQSLLIDGHHNPLKLLHSALSAGLHRADISDEDCLALANSIRLVLAELAERLNLALKSDSELGHAISQLLKISAAEADTSASNESSL